jgi:hypothetical protein
MTFVEKISGTEFAIIGAIGRHGEHPHLIVYRRLVSPPDQRPSAQAINSEIRARSLYQVLQAPRSGQEGLGAWLQCRGKGEWMHTGNVRMLRLYLSS